MPSGSRITGRDRLRYVLTKLPPTVRKEIREAILAGAEEMAGTMRNLAAVHSGALRDSIKVSPADEKRALYDRLKSKRTTKDPELAAIIEADAFYAPFVEFGTAPHTNQGEFKGTLNPGTHAQPFFFPGFRARKKQVQARINRAARQGIKDGLR